MTGKGKDKGSFTPGVGYTSYHAKPRLVCMTRHTRGCPHPAVCPKCRSLQVPLVTECSFCHVPCEPYPAAAREPTRREG